MAQVKLSEKQYDLLCKLYVEQGKRLTPEVEKWLQNLPALEAPKYIDKWIGKNRKRSANRQSWRSKG